MKLLFRRVSRAARVLLAVALVGGGALPTVAVEARPKADKPPQQLIDDLKALDQKLTERIKGYEDGTIKSGDLDAVALARMKYRIINSYFDTFTLYGVPGNKVILYLDFIDSSLS